MEKIWKKFKEQFDGEQSAREAFNNMCTDILERHFPTKKIVSAAIDTKIDSIDKSLVVFQSKLFLEGLTNSRKGQIRKAFKDSITIHHSKKNPLFAWILCIPMTMNEEEVIWWLNWSEKMKNEHQVNIQIFDSEFIINLLEKYNISQKWLENKGEKSENEEIIIVENEEKKEVEFENDLFEIVDDKDEKSNLEDIEFIIERKNEEEEFIEEEVDNSSESSDENDEENDEEIDNETDEKIEETEILEEEESLKTKDNNEKDEETKIEEKSETDNFHEIKESNNQLEENNLSTFKLLKSQHLAFSKNTLSLDEEEKEEIKLLSKKNKFQSDRFDFDDIIIDDITTPDLIFKAKSYKVNENYEKALYIYEKILERTDLQEESKKDVEKGLELCENMIIYRNKLSEGDFYFTKKDYVKALEAYEVSYQIDNKSKEIIRKYNFTFAEALVEQKIYQKAIEKYDEALKAEPNSSLLQNKRAFAQLMFTGNKVFKKTPAKYLNPLVAPWFYKQAYKIDNTNTDVNLKLKKIRKNSIYTLVSIVSVAIIIYLILLIPPIQREIVYAEANKATSMYEYQMQSGEYFMANFSEEKAHYIDSAIYSFRNAIRYKPHDSIAPIKVEEAKKIKEEYIERAQELINLDSAGYFLSMRDPSEGLRLFKYLFEPYNKSKGKFGYVDENMNIVIPPIFDFNYKTMLNAGERFKDGKALVCLEISEGDTLYFYIDKNCNRVE